MEFAGTGLFVVGLMVAIAGWIMIVVAAFRVSVGWGVGSLLIPLIALIFVITHWQDARRGFFTELGGASIFIFGVLITPSHAKPPEQKPAPVAEKPVEYVPASAYTPPTPQPKKYVPPRPAEEPAQPAIAKVYADRTTLLYYPADCATHPESALLMSKTVAVMQGYKPGECK